MVYLVGVYHTFQYRNGDNSRLDGFKVYISLLVQKYRITILSEEFNQDALNKNHASCTILQEVAQQMVKKHIFIEPSISERERMGIPLNLNEAETKRYFQIREDYWLNILEPYLKHNVLVICGISHIESFFSLLLRNRIKYRILEECYNDDTLDLYKYQNKLVY